MGILESFITGIVAGGTFALLGAVIGGRYVLHAAREERQRTRVAAARALSAELELNTIGTARLAVAGRLNPQDYLVFHPTLLRTVFDQQLILMSELLTPLEFQSLMGLYVRAASSFALLETLAGASREMTPSAIKTFVDLAEEFALASQTLARRAWPQDQQDRLDSVRENLLKELRQASEAQ